MSVPELTAHYRLLCVKERFDVPVPRQDLLRILDAVTLPAEPTESR